MNISFMGFKRRLFMLCCVLVIPVLATVLLIGCTSSGIQTVRPSVFTALTESDNICVLHASVDKADIRSNGAFVPVNGYYPLDAPDIVVSAPAAFTDGVEKTLSSDLSDAVRSMFSRHLPHNNVYVADRVDSPGYCVFLYASDFYYDEHVDCETNNTIWEYDGDVDSYGFSLVTDTGFTLICRIQDMKTSKTVWETSENISIRDKSALGSCSEDGSYSGLGVFAVRDSPETIMQMLSSKTAHVLESAVFGKTDIRKR